ncbi:hypothetical protein CDL15_Pgr012161 [Punica granatum]|uniref:NB-ARC domain-containing protein n=1 Tax=Punica granatum TaxID=22663 RepID=A0A218XN46_PUNGR|nr:hypothetical protein CDL15_Pgr012161 [Punica granatum]
MRSYKFHVECQFHQHKVSQLAHNVHYKSRQQKAIGELSTKIDDIKNQVKNLLTMKDLGAHTSSDSATLGPRLSSDPKLEGYSVAYHGLGEGDEIVGFLKVRADIIDELLSDELRRLMVSIVGPSGSGKTVLARDIYEDQMVKEQFN